MILNPLHKSPKYLLYPHFRKRNLRDYKYLDYSHMGPMGIFESRIMGLENLGLFCCIMSPK